MPLIAPDLVDERYGDGLWSCQELEEMDARFTLAVSRALSSGHESSIAASATVRLRRHLAEEEAIRAGWDWLHRNMIEGKDVTSAAVIAFVRGLSPVDVEFIREGIRKRVMAMAGFGNCS
jgi:hypothetical protein